MPTLARVQRACLVGLTVAACTSPPTAAPTPSTAPVQSSAATSQVPSAAPTTSPQPAAAPIGTHWEPSTGIGGGSVYDVAHGSFGWVAVGSSCADDCPGAMAAAWFSADGRTWSGGPIHGGVADTDPTANTTLTTVGTDGSTWYAAGVRGIDDHKANPALIWAVSWRSSDGRTWSPAGAIKLGYCYEGCPSIGQLAVISGSAILSWVVKTFDTEHSSVYWTADGGAWNLVKRSAFGVTEPLPLFFDSPATVANGRYVLVGTTCNNCASVWSSANGRTWTQDGTLSPGPVALDLASDGRRVVVAEEICPEDECVTALWTSADGRAKWTASARTLPILRPRVTFAAGTFIVAGAPGPNEEGVRLFGSSDGAEWREIAHDLGLGECSLVGLAGSEDRVLLVGDQDCSIVWVSATD